MMRCVMIERHTKTLTYAEVDRRTHRLARYLLGLGITRDSLVGLHMGRSLNMMIALAAIHKAGAGCIPLSPCEPPEQIARIIAKSQPLIIVTDMAGRLTLPKSHARVLCLGDDWSRPPFMTPEAEAGLCAVNHSQPHRTPIFAQA